MEAFTLANPNGMEVRFIAYGGIIVSVRVPDRNGVLADVTMGYDTLPEYAADTKYCGALIGRYANRIANGQFTLDGETYQLALNDGPNHLHGGPCGFSATPWRVARFRQETAVGGVLCHSSADGDQGYPGTLRVRVTYSLTNANELIVDYDAITDAPTPVNLTQHSYFNLGGPDAENILDHELTLGASCFTPVDADLIPTGEILDVAHTAFDFTMPRRIGACIGDDDEQLRIAGGYDHNFVLDRYDPHELAFAARLHDPRSGRVLDVFTTEPGIQVYSGNHLSQTALGKGGRKFVRHGAIALETQHFPDSPNQPHFPSTILRPDEEFRSRTVYRFSTRPSAA